LAYSFVNVANIICVVCVCAMFGLSRTLWLEFWTADLFHLAY
jgi:hypothetical protein